jgi:hypothetical protein
MPMMKEIHDFKFSNSLAHFTVFKAHYSLPAGFGINGRARLMPPKRMSVFFQAGVF